MKLKRLYQTIRLWTIRGDSARACWARKQGVYGAVGEHVAIMDRKVPLYAKLIRFHNNIQVASNVHFITHDVAHAIYNRMYKYTGGGGLSFQEHIGCIEIMDNVFIGAGTTILGNVRIGPNAIIAAGSLVSKDVPPDAIVGGVPARVIGSFRELAEKRRNDEYPRDMRPVNQDVSPELAEYMWKCFEEARRQNPNKTAHPGGR